MVVPALALRPDQPRRPGRAGRLGGASGHRHRVRARRPGRRRPRAPRSPAHVPADPRRRRRPHRHHDHRGRLHRRAATAVPLLLALVPIAGFGVLVQRQVRSPWLLAPLAVVAWALVHASGVHATVAGVLLGFTVPVLPRPPDEGPGLAEQFEHFWRPISSGFAVPVFAFFASGVSVIGVGGGLGARPSADGVIHRRSSWASSPARPIGVHRRRRGWSVPVHPRPRSTAALSRLDVARARPAGRDRVHRLAAGRGAGLRAGGPPRTTT